MESPFAQQRLIAVAERLRVDVGRLETGMRVPWEGGEEFVTLDARGKPIVIHADINAAQSLQRRFWNRHGEAYRISAVEVRQGNEVSWYPDRDGVRLRGGIAALVGGKGYARLVPAEDNNGYVLDGIPHAQWKRATSGQTLAGDETGLDELEMQLTELLDEEEPQRGERKAVFFRDPSGQVLRADRWYESKEFWGRVGQRISKALRLIELSPADG